MGVEDRGWKVENLIPACRQAGYPSPGATSSYPSPKRRRDLAGRYYYGMGDLKVEVGEAVGVIFIVGVSEGVGLP